MLGHILLMNYLAPLAILAGRVWLRRGAPVSGAQLGAATLVQITVLWIWHLPPAMDWAMATSIGFALMNLSLAATALWFWNSVIDGALAQTGRVLLSLLVTGKLFCLLGILLTFAPRVLYMHPGHAGHAGFGADALADQQLAGLYMLIACPLTYVLAAILIAGRWMADLEAKGLRG